MERGVGSAGLRPHRRSKASGSKEPRRKRRDDATTRATGRKRKGSSSGHSADPDGVGGYPGRRQRSAAAMIADQGGGLRGQDVGAPLAPQPAADRGVRADAAIPPQPPRAPPPPPPLRPPSSAAPPSGPSSCAVLALPQPAAATSVQQQRQSPRADMSMALVPYRRHAPRFPPSPLSRADAVEGREAGEVDSSLVTFCQQPSSGPAAQFGVLGPEHDPREARNNAQQTVQ